MKKIKHESSGDELSSDSEDDIHHTHQHFPDSLFMKRNSSHGREQYSNERSGKAERKSSQSSQKEHDKYHHKKEKEKKKNERLLREGILPKPPPPPPPFHPNIHKNKSQRKSKKKSKKKRFSDGSFEQPFGGRAMPRQRVSHHDYTAAPSNKEEEFLDRVEHLMATEEGSQYIRKNVKEALLDKSERKQRKKKKKVSKRESSSRRSSLRHRDYYDHSSKDHSHRRRRRRESGDDNSLSQHSYRSSLSSLLPDDQSMRSLSTATSNTTTTRTSKRSFYESLQDFSGRITPGFGLFGSSSGLSKEEEEEDMDDSIAVSELSEHTQQTTKSNSKRRQQSSLKHRSGDDSGNDDVSTKRRSSLLGPLAKKTSDSDDEPNFLIVSPQTPRGSKRPKNRQKQEDGVILSPATRKNLPEQTPHSETSKRQSNTITSRQSVSKQDPSTTPPRKNSTSKHFGRIPSATRTTPRRSRSHDTPTTPATTGGGRKRSKKKKKPTKDFHQSLPDLYNNDIDEGARLTPRRKRRPQRSHSYDSRGALDGSSNDEHNGSRRKSDSLRSRNRASLATSRRTTMDSVGDSRNDHSIREAGRRRASRERSHHSRRFHASASGRLDYNENDNDASHRSRSRRPSGKLRKKTRDFNASSPGALEYKSDDKILVDASMQRRKRRRSRSTRRGARSTSKEFNASAPDRLIHVPDSDVDKASDHRSKQQDQHDNDESSTDSSSLSVTTAEIKLLKIMSPSQVEKMYFPTIGYFNWKGWRKLQGKEAKKANGKAPANVVAKNRPIAVAEQDDNNNTKSKRESSKRNTNLRDIELDGGMEGALSEENQWPIEKHMESSGGNPNEHIDTFAAATPAVVNLQEAEESYDIVPPQEDNALSALEKETMCEETANSNSPRSNPDPHADLAEDDQQGSFLPMKRPPARNSQLISQEFNVQEAVIVDNNADIDDNQEAPSSELLMRQDSAARELGNITTFLTSIEVLSNQEVLHQQQEQRQDTAKDRKNACCIIL